MAKMVWEQDYSLTLNHMTCDDHAFKLSKQWWPEGDKENYYYADNFATRVSFGT